MRRHSTVAVLVLALALTACPASQQLTAYKTLGALVTAVYTGMEVYGAEVRAGHISQADQDKVRKAYVTYQQAIGPVIQTKGLTGPVPDSVAGAAGALLGLLNGLGVLK